MIDKFIDNTKLSKNIGLIDGYAKDILVLCNLYKEYGEKSYLKMTDNIIKNAFLSEISLKYDNIGLWNGPLGFSLVLDLLSKNLGYDEYVDINGDYYNNVFPLLEFWEEIDIFANDFNRDYIYGFAGVLLYLGNHSLVSKEVIDHFEHKVNYILDCTLTDLYKVNYDSDNFYKQFSYDQNTEYCILGIAHGICGMIIGLNLAKHLFCQKTRDKINKVNLSFENIILENYNCSNNSILFPICLKYKEGKLVSNFGLMTPIKNNYTWCYGLVGLGIFLNKYSTNNELISIVNNEISHIISFIIEYNRNNILNEDLCICHGYSGIFYYYLNYIDSKSDYLSRLSSFVSKAFSNGNYQNNDSNLLSGHDGIILVQHSLISKKRFIGDFIFGY